MHLTKVCFNFFLNCDPQTRRPCTLSIRVSAEKDAVSAAGSAHIHCEVHAIISCTSGEELLGNQCSKHFPIFLKTRNFPQVTEISNLNNSEITKKMHFGKRKKKKENF